MNVQRIDVGDVRKARRGWKDDDYGEKIQELKRPTTRKYKLLRVFYRVHPFTSINAKMNELVQKDELQDKIIDDLDRMEELVEEFQNDLQEWRDITGVSRDIDSEEDQKGCWPDVSDDEVEKLSDTSVNQMSVVLDNKGNDEIPTVAKAEKDEMFLGIDPDVRFSFSKDVDIFPGDELVRRKDVVSRITERIDSLSNNIDELEQNHLLSDSNMDNSDAIMLRKRIIKGIDELKELREEVEGKND